MYQQYEKTLEKIKQWGEKSPNVSMCFVDYKDVIDSPFEQAFRINEFLNENLQVEKMIHAVDANLYREKLATD